MFPVQVSDYDEGSATHTQKIYFSVHFTNQLSEFWGPLVVQMLHKSCCHPLTCLCYKSNITRWKPSLIQYQLLLTTNTLTQFDQSVDQLW